ncbi:PfkB family carbohydrate kinase [Streptomyces afghaniensis]|uniref:PfkB family carbohydrate kinase n=1 Tax=Streptomyces afghaniensis TaxID=66865 RepID=UPI00277FFCCF|nr:PfkB family carbohydrate kinase [Streptomyces afghaniensis]MDQ1014105.1 sugar/nucleoside kinase (ribokinase family) [Streptomyces afghaniensis]
MTVCFDVNHRSRLWSADRARAALRPILAHIDLLIASEDELPLVLDRSDAAEAEAEAVDTLLSKGVGERLVKRGARGATSFTADGATDRAARRVDAVDLVGAGDAFVAGYLSGFLDGDDILARLHRAVTTAAFAVATRGDWEGLPTRDELGLFDQPDGTTIR